MSYDIHVREQNFRLPASRTAAAFGALKKSGVRVNEGTTSLEDALEELGWAPDVKLQRKGTKRKTPGAGDIVGLTSDREHLTDEVEDTLDAIAPFVDEGSYLEFEGEDFCVWRYLFDGVKVEKIYPTVDWMKPVLEHTSEREYRLYLGAGDVVVLAGDTEVLISPDCVRVNTGTGTVHVRSK